MELFYIYLGMKPLHTLPKRCSHKLYPAMGHGIKNPSTTFSFCSFAYSKFAIQNLQKKKIIELTNPKIYSFTSQIFKDFQKYAKMAQQNSL